MSRPRAVAALAPPQQAVRAQIAAAAGSGLLLAGAFPPLDAEFLAWIALVPLLWALRGESVAGAFRLGALTGLLWFLLTLFWVTLFGLPAWLLLSAILSVYIGGFAALYRWLSLRLPGRDLLLIPLVWTTVEVVRSSGTLGFPWALLGVSQHATLPVLQVAAVGGVHLVSFVIVLANAALVTVLTGRRRSLWAAGGVMVLVAAAVFVGFWRTQLPLQPGERVAVLQPNISPGSKGNTETYQAQLTALRRLTAQAAAGGATVIVFPETAVPANLLGSDGVARVVGSWAPGAVLVASSQEIRDGRVSNFAAVLSGEAVLGTYAKRRLVPFGEAGVTAGDQDTPIVTPAGTLGVLICYESAFAGLARLAAHQGAAVLAVLTNDGWFGESAGPVQHSAYAAVRAVETGRSVARAANTGISMVVDPHGRIQTRLLLGSEGSAVTTAAAPIETFYMRGGWLIPPAMAASVMVVVMVAASGAMREWRRERAFLRLVGVLLWPGIVAFLGRDAVRLFGEPARWWMPAVVLVVVWASAGRRGLGVRLRRVPATALLGVAVVALLGGAMMAAYQRYGFVLPPFQA
ncbi:MAG: apolipoprotein N-acyltransferase, partial [Gemmatimonadales bacterium]